ncbi:MAG: hypothetical protein J6I73_06210 [Treponema sp.]|nr:hypothetical protein [Treponema sp.]
MKSAIIWNGLMIASIVALCIVNGLYAYLIALFVVLPGFLDALLIDAYTKFNGIYKNGIIMGGPMLWEQLFSWKVLDEHHFSILTNDGIRFDMPSANNEDAIKNIFLENGIKEEI